MKEEKTLDVEVVTTKGYDVVERYSLEGVVQIKLKDGTTITAESLGEVKE